MARPLRVEYPGAVYHVMNRGNQRQRVFHSGRYYGLFLEKLTLFAEKFAVEVRAYCLMPNHFHLYLRTPQGNLSRLMQSLLTSYSVVANRWRRSSGHVFQGRFKAQLVQDELYGSRVSRYLHLNPVRVRSLQCASPEEKLAALHAFKWSSFRALAGFCPVPAWLDASASWCRWGENEDEQTGNYRGYVEEGLARDIQSPFAEAVGGTILGSEAFVERVKREHLVGGAADPREQPQLRGLQGAFEPLEVVAAAAAVCGASAANVLCRRGCHRPARRLAMYCVERFCRSRYPQAELASLFSVGIAGFATARSKFAEALAETPELAEQVARVARHLQDSPGCDTSLMQKTEV